MTIHKNMFGKKENPTVMVSGGFDPVHVGHIRMIREAAKYGDVIVIANSDNWLHRKKGYVFMDFEKRLNMFGKQSTQLNESAFENKETNVLGACVMLAGDSPSNLHFFGTDSKKHYLTGSLLFNTVPNYDSLVPALSYIKTDVQKLLESLHWD